jgi:hypothetical protein
VENAAPRGGPPWRARVRALALLIAGAALGAAATPLLAAGDDGLERRRLGNGSVEVVATDTTGDARLVLTGPGEATVGDTVTFEASAEGMDEWAWLMPDGTVYANEPSVQLRTRSAGTAEIALVGTADSGDRLEVVHELRLVEA